MGATVFLSAPEVGVLLELLEGDRCRLLLEIAHTDHRSMRQELKARESLLQGILRKLRQQDTTEALSELARTD